MQNSVACTYLTCNNTMMLLVCGMADNKAETFVILMGTWNKGQLIDISESRCSVLGTASLIILLMMSAQCMKMLTMPSSGVCCKVILYLSLIHI